MITAVGMAAAVSPAAMTAAVSPAAMAATSTAMGVGGCREGHHEAGGHEDRHDRSRGFGSHPCHPFPYEVPQGSVDAADTPTRESWFGPTDYLRRAAMNEARTRISFFS